MAKKESKQVSVNRRLVKMGGSLVVPVPWEVVDRWNMKKGDEIRFTLGEGTLKLEPKEPKIVETIPEETIEAYSKAMKGIRASVTLDPVNLSIHIDFSGKNKEAMESFVRNLYQNLPPFLRLMGLGSVAEKTKGETPK
jgi:antitoxin component of MazEF toxin-antitoxin module